MQHLIYLAALLFAISGLLIVDWRWKLAFWHDAKRTARTVLTAVAVFVLWDMFGIWFGIFFKGSGEYMLPFELFPEFPIEELFFLFLLCYVTLILYRGLGRWRRIS